MGDYEEYEIESVTLPNGTELTVGTELLVRAAPPGYEHGYNFGDQMTIEGIFVEVSSEILSVFIPDGGQLALISFDLLTECIEDGLFVVIESGNQHKDNN